MLGTHPPSTAALTRTQPKRDRSFGFPESFVLQGQGRHTEAALAHVPHSRPGLPATRYWSACAVGGRLNQRYCTWWFRGLPEAQRRVSATSQRQKGFGNDPSAGSPTETLLRLHLPLNDKVKITSRGRRPREEAFDHDPRVSPDHSIGRCDGRCVQRAGT